MSAAVVVPSGSAALAAVAVLPVAVVLLVAVLRVAVPREPRRPALALPLRPQRPPDPLLNLSSLPLPQAVVESEVRVHLQGRRSFSAAMARSSPQTGKPTC